MPSNTNILLYVAPSVRSSLRLQSVQTVDAVTKSLVRVLYSTFLSILPLTSTKLLDSAPFLYSMSPKKVAIVGSGCSGIGALWALKNTDHEVHLYESASRLGGHTNTVTFEGPDGQSTNVDTGFIVFNTATYRQSYSSERSFISSSQSWCKQTLSLF